MLRTYKGEKLVEVTPVQQIISSCSGALMTSALTTPFDVVKVRLQSQQQNARPLPSKPIYIMDCCTMVENVCICTSCDHHRLCPRHMLNMQAQARSVAAAITATPSSPAFTGTIDAFIRIAKEEGLRSWWRGLPPTLVMSVPATVIYYTTYDQLKVKFGFKPDTRNMFPPLLAGGIARTLAVTAICPLELIRTKLQSRSDYTYRELSGIVRNTVAQHGILSLWRGLGPMLIRDVPFSMFYWIVYEDMKVRLTKLVSPVYHPLLPFFVGSVAGGLSAAATTPLDVVKTHMQVEIGESARNTLGAGSTVGVMKSVIRDHGIQGLFVGIVPRCAKIAPACAIMIGSYETCKSFFADYNARNS